MHAKHAASELRAMALRGAVAACEMRAFAARHAATLDAANHADFVEAFVLQLGRPEQHAAVLALLAGVERGKIAYKPPVLEVARWVDARVGGLAHAELIGRAARLRLEQSAAAARAGRPRARSRVR